MWIVSKCGESVQNKTLGWLSRWGFYASTGLVKGNVRFCRKRHEKAPICRHLGVTHFVDDRLEVLRPMVGVVPYLFLFGEQATDVYPAWAVAVPDWPATVEAVLAAGRPEPTKVIPRAGVDAIAVGRAKERALGPREATAEDGVPRL